MTADNTESFGTFSDLRGQFAFLSVEQRAFLHQQGELLQPYVGQDSTLMVKVHQTVEEDGDDEHEALVSSRKSRVKTGTRRASKTASKKKMSEVSSSDTGRQRMKIVKPIGEALPFRVSLVLKSGDQEIEALGEGGDFFNAVSEARYRLMDTLSQLHNAIVTSQEREIELIGARMSRYIH